MDSSSEKVIECPTKFDTEARDNDTVLEDEGIEVFPIFFVTRCVIGCQFFLQRYLALRNDHVHYRKCGAGIVYVGGGGGALLYKIPFQIAIIIMHVIFFL